MYCKSANIGQIWAQCPKIDLQNLECSGYTLSIVYKINFVIICLILIDRVKKLQQNPLNKNLVGSDLCYISETANNAYTISNG